MNFLAPMMLAGAAAISIPIAIHFFYKARYKPLPWGAMKFLLQSIEQTSRRLKFQEYILLALRCLLLILLALALARPTTQSLAVSGRGESTDAVFVFDTSFSMGAMDGEKTRLERAQDAAISVIDNLPPNSTVQVLTCTDRVTTIPFTPSNLDQARQVVKNLTLTSMSGDLYPGLVEAQAAIDRAAGANKEIYVFTDLQSQGFTRQESAIQEQCKQIQERATLVLVRCGNPERPIRNVAIFDIQNLGGIPHTGTRMPFTVLLKNTGLQPLQNISVTLEIDGQRQDIDTGIAPEIAPGQTYPITLTGKLTREGATLVTARVGQAKSETEATRADDLPGDNRYDKILPVRDRIRVLLIDGAPDLRDPKESATHFIRNALLPVTQDQLLDYFVRVNEITADQATPTLLGDADICIMANVPALDSDRPGIPALSSAFLQRLTEFVRSGNSLVIAPGDFVTPQSYNATFGQNGNNLLPSELGDVLHTTAEKPFRPVPDSIPVPSFLDAFRNEPFSTVTADVEVYDVIPGKALANTNSQVLLRLNQDTPLVTTKNLGLGEVILFHTSLDTRWTNWPAKAHSYLSMMQFMLGYLSARGTSGTNRVAGEPLVYQPQEANKPFELIRPDLSRTRLGDAKLDDDGLLSVTAGDVTFAGEYQMTYQDAIPPQGPRYAVIPDLRESENLESLTDDDVEKTLGFRPVIVTAGNEANTIGTERNRREWTVWLLLAALLLALGECSWAWYCGRAI